MVSRSTGDRRRHLDYATVNGARSGPAAPSRFVTVFNGARDGYQVPLALAEAGRLESFVTDWYSPLDRPVVRAALSIAPARVRTFLTRRHHPALASTAVESMPWQALRQRSGPRALAEADARLGRRAGELARQRAAGVLAYNYYGHAAFRAYGDGAGPRILVQVQAHPAALQRVLREERDAATDDDARAAFDAEPDLLGASRRSAEVAEEPFMADRCVAPSTYVRQTLIDAGVPADRVAVVPYGVDLDVFTPVVTPTRPRPFRVLFVGQLRRRKGLHYLLEAWRQLAMPDAELVLVGHGDVDASLLRRYAGHFQLKRDVRGRAAMARLYAESDVCCLPSLSDAFGHVLLESLACGTPIIATPNTAAPDLVMPGENGLVVPIRDVKALARALTWFVERRGDLREMRLVARQSAERFSWPAFRAGLIAQLG